MQCGKLLSWPQKWCLVLRTLFNDLEANKQEELYEPFPMTHREFSRLLAGSLWLISTVSQEGFVNSGNSNDRKNLMYIRILEQIPLLLLQ
jgi:hypothetical protein